MENTLIQGKAKDWCSKCKNGTCYLKDSDSYICTDPYDNEERAIGAQTDIECSMFEPKTTLPSEESRIEELIKASKRKDELIQDYRDKLKDLKDKYEKLDTHYRYDEAIIKDIQDIISPEDDSIWSYSEIVHEVEKLKKQFDENEITKLENENISLNTINKGLAEDRKKLINYIRSLKIASENYLKEFTYGEEPINDE